VDVIHSPGSLLGCLPNPGLADIRLLLGPGELLLLYTDGVTEARHAKEQFSDTRLRSLVAANTADAHQIVHKIIDAALAHSNGELADDAAVMAILAT
jgi:sigma-B regulation protein RsbU (phosphoserine phosphatase)